MAVLEGVERRQRLEGRLPIDRHDAPKYALVQTPAPAEAAAVNHALFYRGLLARIACTGRDP